MVHKLYYTRKTGDSFYSNTEYKQNRNIYIRIKQLQLKEFILCDIILCELAENVIPNRECTYYFTLEYCNEWQI